MFGEAVGREQCQSRKGVSPLLKETVAGVLTRVQLGVGIRAALMSKVCWFKELSENHRGGGAVKVARVVG